MDRTLCLIFLSVVVGASANGYGYGPNPNTKTSKKIQFYPQVFIVQGVIYCKSPFRELQPLKGSVVRITCLGIDKVGYETAPFSILSRPTDANGYFLAKISSKPLIKDDGVKITQCKAFIHSSGLRACSFATDFKGGSSGAPLSAYRTLGSDGIRLYTVGPFVYN